MEHKAGFVNIIGNPNVGKSTLMNSLVGEKLSIITPKAQTTRHRIMGIVNGEAFQIVYSDTPGIIKPGYKLQEAMMKFVGTAIIDADIILYVTDVKESPEKNSDYIEKVNQANVPVILLINKIDLSNQEELENLVQKWHELVPLAQILPVSAISGFNLSLVLKRIIELLPESPPYFPKDELTDKPERFFAAEIIREKIFLNYQQEIPYSIEVQIEEFHDTPSLLRINAVILVVRDSQKSIIIGKKGLALKKTATQARLDMEKFFDKKVFLEVFVKVSKDWRDKDSALKNFGYN
jgi:GTPase